MRKWISLVAACVMGAAVAVPSVAGAAGLKPTTQTNVAAVAGRPSVPKPAAVPHPDVAPTASKPASGTIMRSGSGDSSNNLSFHYFTSGDIVVGLGTPTGHAGLWDDTKHYYDSSYCVWSANTEPRNGVQLEQGTKYRRYDRAYGLWVGSVSATARNNARNFASWQNGEPYNINSSKTDYTQWYCSKLPWAAYKYMTGLDLDADGGYWVWPVDLVNDNNTSTFVYSD